MQTPKLIAFDLDGTLLNSKKELTAASDAALRLAHARGAELVIATGRFFNALPEQLRTLPYVRYYLTVNGGQVYDRETGRVLYRAEIPWQQCVRIMEYFDTLPVIYDCYMDDQAWMTTSMRAVAEDWACNEFYRGMTRLRQPVPELKAFLAERQLGVQKTMCLFQPENMPLRAELLQTMQGKFPDIAVTSSIPNNIEINQKNATKGAALTALAEELGIPMAQTMAFGDDLNDIQMLKAAGCGVAMGSALPEVKKYADLVTEDCDHDGVAKVLFQVFS